VFVSQGGETVMRFGGKKRTGLGKMQRKASTILFGGPPPPLPNRNNPAKSGGTSTAPAEAQPGGTWEKVSTAFLYPNRGGASTERGSGGGGGGSGGGKSGGGGGGGVAAAPPPLPPRYARENELREPEPEASVPHDVRELYAGVFAQLDRLRSPEWTDVTVSVSGVLFHAHRVVLAAWSAQLQQLLLRCPAQVQLGGMDADAFGLVLDYIYDPRQLELSMQTVAPVLVVAQRLGISAVKELCSSFLLRQLSTANCKHLHVLASTHGLAELKLSAWQLLSERPKDAEQPTPSALLLQVSRTSHRQPQFATAHSTPSAQEVVEQWAKRLNGVGAGLGAGQGAR
jgi:hypothetical protein